jgi:hypothetical protein
MAAAAHHERPFTGMPGRWERACARARRAGHARHHSGCAAGERVPVYERTRWGWLAWPVPQDGGTPEHPQQIGVLTPAATRTQRLALRWLTRRPARHVTLPFGPAVQARRCTMATAVIGLAVAVTAVIYGVAAGVALPAMLLVPLLTEHVPQRLDDRARAWVRSVDAPDACRHLQRLASLQSYLVQAAAAGDRYELRRSAEVGQHVLWDAADLLRTRDTRAAAVELTARERLLAQLADQVAQILNPTRRPAPAPPPAHR